ncbi:hypothetical protein WEI85_03345 [Actinomycetes bacterium KLBMP 9797]
MRLFAAATAPILVAGLLVVTGQPAQAIGSVSLTRTSWASTDARHPHQIVIDGPDAAPVGSWHDDQGRKHTSRAYFTFDISRFRGTVISSAEFVVQQTAATDCTRRPPIELWRTENVTDRSSWRRPPRPLALLHTSTERVACPAPRVEFDALAGFRQAVAAGKSTLTLALRLPAGAERDPANGMWFANAAKMSVDYNTPPEVPTELTLNPNQPCASQAPRAWQGTGDAYVSARLADADMNGSAYGDLLEVTFAAWPVDRPEERTERRGSSIGPGVVSGWFPADLFRDGETYAWAARAFDRQDYSAWSQTCYFTVDNQRPQNPPLVSSAEYPNDGEYHGGAGIEGTFTFTANGVPDVVRYQYSWDQWVYTDVAADGPGGAATIRYTPDTWGTKRLYVRTEDAAGNRSGVTQYEFNVANIAPRIDIQVGGIGEPTRFTFGPNMLDDVVGYEYQIDDGDVQTVAAGADGTATVTVVLATGGDHTIRVASQTVRGIKPFTRRTFTVPTAPVITSTVYPSGQWGGGQGVPGAFTFHPRVPDGVAYRYTFGSGPATRVAAGDDGTATVTWTPTTSGAITLTVVSVRADGTESASARYSIYVRDLTPEVSSDLYTEWWPDGGPGVPSTFTFRSELPALTVFAYRLNGGPEQTLAATDGAGAASVVITPDRAGEHTLVVRALGPDGHESPERTFIFLVAEPAG